MAPSSSDQTNHESDNDLTAGGPTRLDGWENVDMAIKKTAKPILEFGRAWMMAPTTAARAKELKLEGQFGFWTSGRAGVLGDVDADVVAAAIGFMAPAQIRQYWDNKPVDVSPMVFSEAYLEAAAAFGRSVLGSMPEGDLNRLAELGEAIAASAPPSTGSLFAGWRALQSPEDPAGRATVALGVLRELRGGAHLSAVHAVGLGPHGAILSTDDPVRGGVPWAEVFGWTAPHPSPDHSRRAEAEMLTDRICRPGYDGLTASELEEFSSLVATARSTLDS